MSTEDQKATVLKGFSPVASQIYLEKQPNLSLFCKPLILPLKSPNLQMLEKMEAAANANEIDIQSVLNSSDK
ncbi:hypothetical protein M9Y10_016531 [Tritrichomonas musculus]|uniref:BBSome-interacting protein 1 n=1 Tax=Tritrichomonas musculus TaxID=1915356 RepID=A0ABR2HWT3_9EUKA